MISNKIYHEDLEMEGPYNFTLEEIQRILEDDKIGNFACGIIDNESNFIVQYIGRSDVNIKECLKEQLNKNKEYKYFKFSYANSVKSAFEKECKNFHDFGEEKTLNNSIHPQRPDEKTWKCPFCFIFDNSNE